MKVLTENNIKSVEEPEIEITKMVPGEIVIFRAEVSVVPKVTLGEYRNLKISSSQAIVKKEELDKAIETLQKSRAIYKTVLRQVQKGDRVEIDFETKVDGIAIDGGISKQHPLIVGEGHFINGFEDELIGMKEKEEKSFSLFAPKDYYQKDLAAKKIDFNVKMNLIQEVELPELNNEFAAKLGKFSSFEELKKSVEEGLLDEKKNKEKEKNRLEMINMITKSSSFEIPEKLIEFELTKMEQEFLASLAQMNIEVDSYLTHIKKTLEDLKKQWREQAEKRVGASLVLHEIAQEENIIVSDKEIEEKTNQILKNVTDMKQAKNINPNRLKENIKAILRNEKVFQLLEENLLR